MRKILPPAPDGETLDEDFGFSFPVRRAAGEEEDEHAGTPNASPAQVHAWTRAFRDNLAALKKVHDDSESTKAQLAHTLGTYARELKGRGAWMVVNAPDWPAFCTEHLQLSERHVRRLAYFAEEVTAEQAAFGVRKCIAGLALVERLKLRSLSELVLAPGVAEPPAWAQVLGAPVQFRASSARRLEELAEGPKKLRAKPSDRVAQVVERRSVIIERVGKREPAIHRLGVRSVLREGKARVTHRSPSSNEEIAALAALYVALRRDT